MVIPQSMAQQYQILISDDDDTCREAVREALEPQGYSTQTASCGQEAIHIVRRRLVHVMIVDMNMPDLSGLETVTIIRREIASPMPSILMSADMSGELVAQAESAQVDSYLAKPFDLDALRRIVEGVIRRYYE